MAGNHVLILLVLASTTLAQNYCPTPTNWDPKIYTIALGHDWGAYEYFDSSGYILGFSMDIVNAVCDAAGIQCRTVWDKYTNCLTSNPGEHTFGGRGLLGGWYDACTGWVPTVERVHIFDFSMAYLQTTRAFFYVLPGNSNFDSSNLQGKSIGFMRGWMWDEKCLARHDGDPGLSNYVLERDQIMYFDTPADAYTGLVQGNVDAIFTSEDGVQAYLDQNQVVSGGSQLGVQCYIGGNGMMTRKDSDFNAHWNRGFQKLRSTGQFYKLCQKANQDHARNGRVFCVD